ncbi:MAG TPA: Na/Pi symporter [Kofleriaceae bacterium]|nr:Na/Pi symporter [Kofleriaceae bacterium]
MASLGRRGKSTLRWLLTIAIVVYTIGDWGEPGSREAPQPSDEPGASTLTITSLSDADVNPGDAIVVAYEGAEGNEPVTARIAKQPAEILVREAGSLVVRIPADAPLGKAGMRLVQGERRSKSWDLHIRPQNYRKLVARLLGGLALFVYGLGLLATALRGLTGQRLRSALGRLTRSPPQAVGVGVLVGAVTQLTSSAAALAVGLVEARLLALVPAMAILVGAQLGASITGALLPVALSRESLLVIAIGVLWIQLSTGRRARAVAELVLGAGLMLFGLHLLQTSVEPLVSDPKLLPYLDQLRGDGMLALLLCAVTGALLALVLQGPGPVYVLVVGLVHVSSTLPPANALAILAGTSFGAALGVAFIAWRRSTRPLVGPHLAYGAAATVIVLASLPLWTHLANASVGSTGNLPARLAIGFAASQVVFAIAWLAVLPALGQRIAQPRARRDDAPAIAPDALALEVTKELVRNLERQRLAAEIALETSCSGDRARAEEADEALAESRRAIERQYSLLGSAAGSPQLDDLAGTLLAVLQLQRVLEQLVRLAELGIERGLRLTPDEQARLSEMHGLARASFDALIEAVDAGAPPDLEAAGAREIEMNQLEARGRTTVIGAPRKNESATVRLGISELVDGYEHVGNHLYRVTKTLAGERDDLV